MAELYKITSQIDRIQRKIINDTFADIAERFSNLQRQINILAGDNDVDELINRIADALNNSESTLEELQKALSGAQQEISAMLTATTNASNATNAANQATTDATHLINDMTALQTDLEQLQTSLNQVMTDATQATTAANTSTNNANQATQNAKQATTDANNAAGRANDAAESIEGWGQALPFQGGTYHRNNVVTFEGSTYQSLIDDNTSSPTDNTKWIVLARKGLDGLGAVQTVNEKSPDGQGNVEVGISDIDGLQGALNEKAQDVDLAALEETVTKHSNNGDIHVTRAKQNLWDRYIFQSAIENIQGTIKTPNDYRNASKTSNGSAGSGTVFREFNNRASLSNMPNSFAYVETVVPWTDTSGGVVWQKAYGSDGNVFYRYETTAGSNVWGAWRFNITNVNGRSRIEYELFVGSVSGGTHNLTVHPGFANLKAYDEVIVFGVTCNGGAATFQRHTEVINSSLIYDIYSAGFSQIIIYEGTTQTDEYWLRWTVNFLQNTLNINFNRARVNGTSPAFSDQNYITRIVGVKYA